MVRPGAGLRDPPDASLRHLLLPQGNSATVRVSSVYDLSLQASIALNLATAGGVHFPRRPGSFVGGN